MDAWQVLAASKTIAIYSCPTQSRTQNVVNPIFDYNPHRGIVNCAVYNHTNKVIASCGQDSKISLHSALSPKDKLYEIQYSSKFQQPSSVNACLFSPKSKYLFAGSANSSVNVWDMKNNKDKQPIKKLKGHRGAITSLAWIGHQEIIASSSTNGDIHLHDVPTGGHRESFSSKGFDGINCIRSSEGDNFKRLACCTNSGSLLVWDLLSGKKMPIYSYDDPKKASITCLSISAFKPMLVASVSLDCTLTFSDFLQKKIVKQVCTEEPLTSVAFHSNGQTIAVGGMNGSLLLYDLKKLSSPIYKLQGHDTPIKSVCFAQKIQRHNSVMRESQKQKIQQKFSKDYHLKTQKSSKNIEESKVSTKQIPLSNPSSKALASAISASKLPTSSQDIRPIRNLAKKEQVSDTLPQYSKQPQILNNNFMPSNSNVQQSKTNVDLRALEQKINHQNVELRMEINERFDGLHLEIIRQMQNMVRQIGDKLQSSNRRTFQLEQKVRLLQHENQSLKKRTY